MSSFYVASICLFFSGLLLNPLSAQLIVAHRGASEDAPENTLAAFRLAWEQNADAIEGDFHLTADNKIACMHDPNTGRVCPAESPMVIAETELAKLKTLDVGSWKDAKFSAERIPTLADVLAIVPDGKTIYVEVKSGPEIVPFIKQEVTESSLTPDQVLFISFHSDVIRQLRDAMPEYRANLLTDYYQKNDGDQKVWHPTADELLTKLAASGATGLGSHAHGAVVTQELVDVITGAGFEFHAWTIDKPEVAARLKSLGTMSLTTNRPAVLRASLEVTDEATGEARDDESDPSTEKAAVDQTTEELKMTDELVK